MEPNKVGIDQSKKMFAIVGGGITAVANIDTNQDGKIQTLEVLNGVQTVAFKVIGNIPNITEFKTEVTDYTEAEKEELIATLAAETQMKRQKIQVLFERGADIVLGIIDFVIDAQKEDAFFEGV